MHENAKNRLLELLKNLGCSENCADFQSQFVSPSGLHQSTVIVRFPDGRIVQSAGEERGHKTDADISAAQATIEHLCNECPDLIVNWAEINVEAQAGDALIKLGIYLSTDIKSASDKSQKLQNLESDSHLAQVFDQWKNQGDPDLAMWGANLSKKRKATLVEALLWQRFGRQIITADASGTLQALTNTLATK